MFGPADLHGPGWFRFQCQAGFKVVCVALSNQKGVRRTFYHIYTSGEWGIPILPPEDGPRFRLNQMVPKMSREEAVMGICLSTILRIATRDLTYVPSWLPTPHEIRDKMFLAAVGLSRSCDKAELNAETVSVPPPPKDTETKKTKRPHVRSRKLKGDVEKEEATEKAASKVSEKASERAPSGVSSGSKKRVEVVTEDRPQELARVKSVVQTIYTDADDEALLNLGHGEINALNESWLETFIRMTSVINHRSQFEEGVSTLTKEVESMKKQVADNEAEIPKLNTEVDSQKETFEKAYKVVNEVNGLKTNKKVLNDLNAAIVEKNDGAQRVFGWMEEVSRGVGFSCKMPTNSYRVAVRETKERLKGILAGPDSSLNWNDVEVEFDLRVAEEQRREAKKKVVSKKKDATQTSASTPSSQTLRPQPLLLLPRALPFFLKGLIPKFISQGKALRMKMVRVVPTVLPRRSRLSRSYLICSFCT
ncbi:hypothetical protein BVRB_4g092680 [Beta vulgaris subsp. vulgaris]|uniref:Uncharacterized protein n=1 Tax=Beta vulgaris subsp. vulgaris TaxID=3555 RepID=A0A0J8BAM6_BETVV|nr:hypothetical protein BVRB_4g092680 [Beta vulgaris subsp. vulgaris]